METKDTATMVCVVQECVCAKKALEEKPASCV